MQNLGNFTDTDVQADYTLYYGTIAEVREHLTKVYGDINPDDFITRRYEGVNKMLSRNDAKIAGLYHNTFLITQNLFTDNPLLIDGFSRLFVAYDRIKAQKVFIKDYITLTNAKAMSLLGIVNFWKTTESFTPLFDRGFTLYMFMKFGCNIKPLIERKGGEPIIGYFEKDPPLFYEYHHHYSVYLDPKMIFNNERVFDDILALYKLYDLKSKDDLPYAIQFYAILNGYRVKEPNKVFDTEAFIKWIEATPKMTELALKLRNSGNVTSKTTIMTEAFQLAWNKYVLPILFNEEGKQTLQEKKKAFQAMALKAKKAYKKIVFKDLIDLPVDTKIYYIRQEISDLKFEIKSETYLGYKFEKDVDITSALSNMAKRQGLTRSEDQYTFSFKKEDGSTYERNLSLSDYFMTNIAASEMYIKK